jgi:hypothetical protein
MWWAALYLSAPVLAVIFLVIFARAPKPLCRRCGARVTPREARDRCCYTKCPHERAPTLGDLT